MSVLSVSEAIAVVEPSRVSDGLSNDAVMPAGNVPGASCTVPE